MVIEILPAVTHITKRCMVCGERGMLVLDPEAFERYQAGGLAQDCFPELNADQREQLISGTHPECWDKLFGPEDEGHDFVDDEINDVECAD